MTSHSQRRYVSKLFQFFGKLQPKAKAERQDQELGLACKSHMLMLYNDIIAPSHAGGFHLLPLGLRAYEKLTRLVDQEMERIGGQKIAMTTLTPIALWQKSGRFEAAGPELFTLTDRHSHNFCLGPTHEELVTKLIGSLPQLSYKQLPYRLYQITRKFRDEMAPKYGLLRGREFEMKDMYSFDTNEATALESFEAVNEAYKRLFDTIGVPYVKVAGATGLIGGDLSHEYHFPAEIGQDSLLICQRCSIQMNKELAEGDGSLSCACQLSASQCEMQEHKGIEVGHTFYLGTKYSSVFKASYRDSAGNKQIDCSMGCYGLGMTRILQASVEVLSTDTNIRWPQIIAPYQICIIPKKDGSRGKEFMEAAESLSDALTEMSHLKKEVVIDDRLSLTIGRRQFDSDRLGYPYIVILGTPALEDNPSFEVVDTARGETSFMSPEQFFDFARQIQTV